MTEHQNYEPILKRGETESRETRQAEDTQVSEGVVNKQSESEMIVTMAPT